MSDKASVGRDSNKFMFRMPDGLRDKIKILAAKNRRSMNAELLLIVERAVGSDEEKGNAAQ